MTMLSQTDAYRGRRVLITGGLGFIGSNLAHKLVEFENIDVSIVDAMIPDLGGNMFNIEEIRERVSVHIGNIGDSDLIKHLVAGVDYIFNLAGNVSHVDSMSVPQLDLELNCSSQLTLLEACRNYNPQAKVIYASTRQVYGKPLYLPLDENHPICPLDINGINKYAAECYHFLYHRVYGLRTICLRLTNTFGPRQMMKHGRQGFIPWFVRRAIEGKTIDLFGDGKQQRDINYVDDVVEALILAGACESEGTVFNLGADEPITLSDFAMELLEIAGTGNVRSIPFPAERQPIDIGNVYSSYQKINSEMGWSPKSNLRSGLEKTIEFYRENREQYWSANIHTLHRPNQFAGRSGSGN
jgi:UDP-glucose 4-epimerase